MASCSKKKSEGTGDGEAGMGVSDQDLALQNQKRFGNGNIPNAEAGGMFQDVRFDFDSSSVRPEYQAVLKENARIIAADSSLQVVLEGHCDKRGTNEYNLALGESRARAVAGMLVNHGASSRQISTISYGEEIPLEQGNDEEAFAQNRRVHFATSGTSGNAQ